MISVFSLITWQQITLIIFVLLSFGVLLGLRIRNTMLCENKNLNRLREVTKEKFEVNSEVLQDSDADAIEGVLSMRVENTFDKFLFFRPERSVVWERIRNLEQVKENAGRFDRSSLSVVARSRFNSQMTFIRYIAGILILIGLFGTLCGLTRAVSGLGSAVEKSQENKFKTSEAIDKFVGELRHELANTLSGMRMAFMTTLIGVLSTILLTGFISLLRREQLNFMADLESFTTTELLPKYLPQSDSSNIEKISENFNESSISLHRIYDKLKVDTEREKSLVARIQSIADILPELVQKISVRDDQVFRSIDNSIGELAKNIGESHQTSAALKVVILDLSSSIKHQLQGELEARSKFLSEFANTVRINNENFIKPLRILTTTIQGIYEGGKSDTRAIVEATRETTRLFASLKEIESENKNTLLNLKNHLSKTDQFDKLTKELNSQTEFLQSTFKFGKNGRQSSVVSRFYDSLGSLNTELTSIKSKFVDSEPFQGFESRLDDQKSILEKMVVALKEDKLTPVFRQMQEDSLKNQGQLTDLLEKLIAQSETMIKTNYGKRSLRVKQGKSETDEILREMIYKIDDLITYHEHKTFSKRIGRTWKRLSLFIQRFFAGLRIKLRKY